MTPDNVLFVNLIVNNVSEAVKARVTKKLERAVLLPNAMIDQAAQTASAFTTPRFVAQSLSQVLCKKLPEKMKRKGVTVKMEEVFRENTFVVLRLTVIHVNPLILTSAWAEMGMTWILETMGASNRKKVEDDYLPNIVTNVLAGTISTTLDEKMADKKIDAETKVLKAHDQAIFFFAKLNQLRTSQEDERRERRNPIKSIRKAITSAGSSVGSSSLRSEDDYSVDTPSTSAHSYDL